MIIDLNNGVIIGAIRITPRTSQILISEENYLTYQNDTFSFKIDYPSTWTAEENNPDLLFRVRDVVVYFLSPPEINTDFASENHNVVASKLDESYPKSLDGLPEALTPYFREIFGMRDPVSFQDTSLDGNPAKKIFFSYDAFGKTLENTQVYSINSDYLYVITYICESLTCSACQLLKKWFNHLSSLNNFFRFL